MRLTDQPESWRDQIVAVWHDVIRPDWPARLRLVLPQPPCSRFECNQAHVFVEQGQLADHIAFLISIVDLASSDLRVLSITHSAHSDEPLQTARSIVHKANPPHFGPQSRAHVLWKDRLFAQHEPDILDEGTNVIVRIMTSDEAVEVDSTSFMQLGSDPSSRPFRFNPLAPEFHPSQPLPTSQNCDDEFIEDLRDIWTASAFSWEDEVSTINVAIWFTDHSWIQPHGSHYRIARLWPDRSTWKATIEAVWADHRVPGAPLEHHVVAPQPILEDQRFCAHIILLQNPREDWVTSLVTFHEENNLHTPWKQMAVTTHEHILLENLFRAMDLFDACISRTPTFICTAWYLRVHLRVGTPLPGRSGYGIHGRLQRLTNVQPANVGSDHTAFLQLPSPKGERQTRGLVAHDHGPPGESASTFAITVIHGTADEALLPSYIEVPESSSSSVRKELQHWGIRAQVHLFQQCDVAVCFTQKASCEPPHHGVAFSVAAHGIVGPYYFEGAHRKSEIELMKFLHRSGHPKAVIIEDRDVSESFQAVFFQEPTASSLDDKHKAKPSPSWPSAQPKGSHAPFFTQPEPREEPPDCLLKLGISPEELQHFFNSAKGTLHTSFEGLGLEANLYELLSSLPLLEDALPDRYIIYVDGSSQGQQKHRPTDWVEEVGIPDAWAMLVLAESYATDYDAPRLSLVGWTAQQVRYSTQSPYHLGATSVGSLTAEREGLTWALLWRLGLNQRTPTLMRSDSLLTIQQAQGQIGTAIIEASFNCLRGAYQALDFALPVDHLKLQHVFGHSGEPFNDFTDHVAKLEAQSSFFIRRPELDMDKWRTRMPFLWMLFGEKYGGPAFCSSGFDVMAPALPSTTGPASTVVAEEHTAISSCLTIQVSLCTANILSMYCSPEGFAGKLGYLTEQFHAHALLIGGLQETRTPQGQCTSQQVLRLASGADHGHGGVELWVSLRQPYCYVDETPEYLQASYFQVLRATPRILLVRVKAPHWNALLLVGHAPHSGKPQQECQEWWDSLTDLTQHFRGTLPLFVIIDANAEPGPADGISVFGAMRRESKNTPLWRAFLHSFQLTLPQTCSHHVGGLDTWVSPDGLTSHCLDYVAIPRDHLGHCTRSQLIESFDLGNEQRDHTPLAVQLQWYEHGISAVVSTASTTTFDRPSIREKDLTGFLKDFTGASWQTDVESQIQHFNGAVLHDLSQFCPPVRRGPKKTFISGDIWTIRKAKLQHRQALHLLRKRQTLEAIWCCFRAWKRHDAEFSVEAAFNYGTTLQCHALHHYVAFRHHAQKLKATLRIAKCKGIVERIDKLGSSAPASAILHTLKPFIGSGNAKMRGRQPLPNITMDEGLPCSDPAVALDRWISFFGTMEGGERMSVEEQRRFWLANLQELRMSHCSLEVADLPSLTDLEAAFRQVKTGKATGPDRIPAEICNKQPAIMAKFTYPILLKIILHGQEPLEHKGGRLIPLWKGKLSQSLCEAYRSILISSHIGKCLHRTIRLKQSSIYEAYLQHQQIGGQRKAPVVLGVHLARSFLRFQQCARRPSALLFLDLTEAFYRVLRPLALEGICHDDVLAAMAQRLNLGQHLLADLQAHLRAPCATTRANLPSHLCRALRALHLDTHWHIGDQSDVCRTTIGTRPGDAFADVVFGYL